MTRASRERLTVLVRRGDADLAEAALLCELEADPGLDIDAVCLHLDALADQVRTRIDANPVLPVSEHLVDLLGGEHGFRGAGQDTYHLPSSALLTPVLASRRGLPITLTIVYVAIARRLNLPAFAIHLPGHVVMGLAAQGRPLVVDPFHGGVILDEAALAARVTEVTRGRVEFHRAMLRPAPAVDVVRRLLHNLTRAFTLADRPFDALWTVELKLLLPNSTADDHRVHGDVLGRVGRFDASAAAYESYLGAVDASAPHREESRRSAIQARARLN